MQEQVGEKKVLARAWHKRKRKWGLYKYTCIHKMCVVFAREGERATSSSKCARTAVTPRHVFGCLYHAVVHKQQHIHSDSEYWKKILWMKERDGSEKNESDWERGEMQKAKKTEKLDEYERGRRGEESEQEARRKALIRGRERLSAAEYLTAEKQFDTLAPCYHPIIKIPHKVKHRDTSSTGCKHYITPIM